MNDTPSVALVSVAGHLTPFSFPTSPPGWKFLQQYRAKKAQQSAHDVLTLLSGTTASSSKKSAHLKKLKHSLAKPDKARLILTELKSIDKSSVEKPDSTRVVCLSHPDQEVCAMFATRESDKQVHQSGSLRRMNELLSSLPTQGGLMGAFLSNSGPSAAIGAGITRIIKHYDIHQGLSPPVDHIWGYEIALPPPSMLNLASAHSIATTASTFLQAIVAAEGAPELVPMVQFVSKYIDMEFKAIRGQDRGNGVVIAAIWLLPAILIPRPWDFDEE